MSLERAKNGVLLLSRGGAPECVVPANLKLEKAEGATPAELADQTDLQGQIVSKSISSTSSIPRLTPGRQNCPGSRPGHRTGRVPARPEFRQRLPAWKSYLGKYPASPHAGEAKAALANLYVQDGQTALAAYQASLKAGQPDYEKLRAAKFAAEAAKCQRVQ